MSSLTDVDPSVIYAMFKGEPGTRKSTQALSFPGRQFWFSWDRKMQALLVPMRLWGIDPANIEYEDYGNWANAIKKLEQLQTNCPYDVLIFDSVTSCGDSILGQAKNMKGGVVRQSGQVAGRNIAGIAVNELEDFNAESSAFHDLIGITKDVQDYKFRQGLRLSVILIAHVIDVKKQLDNKQVISRTIVTAAQKMAAKLPAYCTEVYHFGMEKSIVEGGEADLIIRTQHSGNDFARTALGLPREIKFGDKPLYDTWLKPAIEKLKEKKQPVTKL